MVHGFGHSGYLVDFGLFFAKLGYNIILFDINGFGYSGGERFNCSIDEINCSFDEIFKFI